MEYCEFKKDIIDQNFNFYFDTSALLSLYRKQQDLVDYFDVNIRAVNNDIRIPSTVKKEYNRNVSSAKDHLKNELNKNTKNFQKNIFDRVNQSFNQISELLSNSDSPVLDKFVELQNASIEKLSALNEFVKELEISENKEKMDKVSELMDNFLMLPDNLLPTISIVEQIRLMNEGYTRAKHHFPPGYMDMKDKYHGLKKEALKNSQGQKNPEELTRYLGDYFIWTEIIKDVLSKEQNALFITSDLKEDWWEKPNKEYDLPSYGARRELIEEFSELTGKRIEFIPFDLFVSFLESYNNQESLHNYLFQNIAELESVVSEQVLKFVEDNEELIISDDDIIWDSDVTRGYVPYDSSVEVQDRVINWVEIDSSDEEEDGGLSVELIVSVNIWGDFDVSAGLENEIYRSVNGDFAVEDIRIQVAIGFSHSQVDNVKDIIINEGSEDFHMIVREAEVKDIELIDSGSIVLNYEDPDKIASDEYYQWLFDRDEEQFEKWYF